MLKDKGGKFLHYGVLSKGSIKVDDVVCASIDVERRKGLMRAHSATHLLQKALKSVLGDHVHQAGSLVEPDRLRFDFTHYAALTPEELARVDSIVQNAILEGYPIETRQMPIDEAKKLGATALFSEKYGDMVRVVNMGGYSVELRGGTAEQCAEAFAMALTNLEGLVCDPVAGLVEIPCIKRNVIGAMNAVSCADMALAGVVGHIPADEVIDAMAEVGAAMSNDLRETGIGGLAGTPTGKAIRDIVQMQG